MLPESSASSPDTRSLTSSSSRFSSSAPSVINLRGIVRRFGGNAVLTGIDLTVARGELFGLLGPSGSGKTTLVKLMTGIDRADEGTVELLGFRMPKLAAFPRFGYMAQADALYNELTAYENLTFFASLYGLSAHHTRLRIERTAEIVQLDAHLKKPVRTYSGGMKRRLSLAIAMLHEPELLILDEPTVGIDPVLRQSIWRELSALREGGTTIVLTTHVMDEAAKCSRLGLLKDGRLAAADTPQAIMQAAGCDNIEDAYIALGGGASV